MSEEQVIVFWDDPLRIKKKDGRKSAGQKAKRYEREHPELIVGERIPINGDREVLGKAPLFGDTNHHYFERKFTIKRKGLECHYNPQEAFLCSDCESCGIFPCYADRLWLFNGKCMDYKEETSRYYGDGNYGRR